LSLSSKDQTKKQILDLAVCVNWNLKAFSMMIMITGEKQREYRDPTRKLTLTSFGVTGAAE
jgi:hypothetical protein